MCGIIGYSGSRSACSVCLTALANLEYRGYDSAGVALWEDGGVRVIKARGRLSQLREKVASGHDSARCGIGHTRWATHGSPNDINSHPHRQGRVTLVHNGIIENYLELRRELEEKGYRFASETDSEISAALIDSCYPQGTTPLAAIGMALDRLEGSYAFAILFDGEPDVVYGVRKGSPLIAAVDGSGGFLASDLPAVLGYTREHYLMEEGEIVRIQGSELAFYDRELRPIVKERRTANWSLEEAQKGGYDYFMLKEIHEQPRALHDTVAPRLRDGLPDFSADGLPQGFFKDIRKLNITACGTALYCGMVGKALIERLARIPVEVDMASETRYRGPILGENEAAIIISQSGETADSLAALRLYKEKGIPVIAIVNVVGSSIAREADYCLYTYAGPEIAVASTKAYSVQVAMMYLLAILAAGDKGVSEEARRSEVADLLKAISLTPKVLEMYDQVRDYAATLADAHSLFYIGRGLDYSLAMEGALKLKEISYIHSEAYAAGELKHGTISLVTEGTPVIALATQADLLPKTLSNIREVKARGARVLLVTMEGLPVDDGACDDKIVLPKVDGRFAPLLLVIVLQIIAINAAIFRGCDVDKPRNLAKSVTVE